MSFYSTNSLGKFDGINTARHIGFYVMPWLHALKLELRPCVQTDIDFSRYNSTDISISEKCNTDGA